MVEINADRLLTTLRRLREFGATGTGVVRPTLSAVDMAARRWLAQRMADAGLDARIDGVGTLLGRSRRAGKAMLIGSHSDTQPRGGWLDGAMGVVYAIEIAHSLAEHADTAAFAVDAASWSDEEGSYFGFLGSRSFCGESMEHAIEQARNDKGERLAEAIAAAGLSHEPPHRLEPGRYLGYLEPHIEQGGVLEAAGQRIGVVTHIVGMRDFTIEITGRQNHAGTTPMRLRRDAGAAAIRLGNAIQSTMAGVAGPQSVWTIGRMSFDPGAPSIIPGRATFNQQVRDVEAGRLEAMEAHVRGLVAEAARAGPCGVAIVPSKDAVEPAAMDSGFQDALAAAAERHVPGGWRRMPSGAGHDAQVLARRMPAGMLFVPSIGGVSHDFAEDTSDEDIVLGCQVLATAAASILAAARGR
ncbi:MAG: Zn-dependent hydrolase [Alphaproteobacteria bacterium]